MITFMVIICLALIMFIGMERNRMLEYKAMIVRLENSHKVKTKALEAALKHYIIVMKPDYMICSDDDFIKHMYSQPERYSVGIDMHKALEAGKVKT